MGAVPAGEHHQQAHVHFPALWPLTRLLTEKEVAEELSETAAHSLVAQFRRKARKKLSSRFAALTVQTREKTH